MNKNDFLKWLSDRYEFQLKKSNTIKFDDIVGMISDKEYDFDAIMLEMIETKFFGFPEWADLMLIFDANIIIKESDKKENLKGEWVCLECGGKKGQLENRKTSTGNFDFFVKCKTCDGEGHKDGHNIFKEYSSGDKELFEKELRVLSKNLVM